MKKTYKTFVLILILVINASLGGFFFGYKMAELNMLIINLKYQYNWTNSENSFFKGFLNALNPIGAIIGTLIAGNLFNKMSRRVSLILADIIGIFGTILCIFIVPHALTQIFGRFLSGISTGINAELVPIYINELSPIEISGVMGSLFQFFINIGILIAFLMGLRLPEESDDYDTTDQWWKFVFLFPIITCMIRMVLLLFVFRFDTPFNSKKRGKEQEMLFVLEKIYKKSHIEEAAITLENKFSNNKNEGYKELFTKYKKRTLVGLFLMVTQQFSGCNAILTDSSSLYNYDNNPFKAKIYTIVYSIVLIFATFVSGRFSDKYGRRTLLLAGTSLCSIVLICMGVFQLPQFDSIVLKEMCIYLTFVFVFGFGISLAPISWIYEQEILPEKGVSLAVLVSWICFILVVFLTPILNEKIGISPLYFFFGLYLLFSLAHMWMWLLETKGKTPQEIDLMFATNKVEVNYAKPEKIEKNDDIINSEVPTSLTRKEIKPTFSIQKTDMKCS